MKTSKLYLALLASLAIAAGTALAGDPVAADAHPKAKCCEKAAKEGKTCTHECCAAAAKEHKACEKCAPKKTEEKK